MKDEPSLISMHPFVRAFVLNIVRTIGEKEFGGERFVIDAEMVPKVSDNVMMASMGTGVLRPKLEEREASAVVRKDMSELAAPIERVPSRRIVPVRALPPRRAAVPPVQPRPVAPPVAAKPVAPVAVNNGRAAVDGYGKISPLLTDSSVSTIECLGEGKELMVIRAGQRQKTRIALGNPEIMDVLEKVAEKAHIPLIEGIFRASLPEFSVSAVISKMVGSRFVIKKVTAYNLIERL